MANMINIAMLLVRSTIFQSILYIHVDDIDVHDDRDYDKNDDNDENCPSRLGTHTSLRRCDSYWEEEPIKLSADDNRECYHNHQTTLR